MGRCVWYISKYVGIPDASSAGGRGYLLMRELARRDIKSVIITSDSNQLARVPVLDQPYVLTESEGVRMYWVRTLKYQVAKSVRRILSWIDFEWRLWRMPTKDLPRPDVVVVSSLSLLTVLNGLRLRRYHGARLVVEIRDIWPLTIVEEGGFSPRNPLVLGLGLIEKLAYRRADAIVGTMPNLQAHVAEVLGEPRPVGCVPMGVDERLLDEADVVLVGEIRDGETADIAIKASLTGQIVLSTLHTNDAASSIARLRDMGVDPFLMASSLIFVAAQRLCRKICTRCKVPEDVAPEVLERLKITVPSGKQLFRGKGCPACRGTGFRGRFAILESDSM